MNWIKDSRPLLSGFKRILVVLISGSLLQLMSTTGALAQDTLADGPPTFRPLFFDVNREPVQVNPTSKSTIRISQPTWLGMLVTYHDAALATDQEVNVHFLRDDGQIYGPWLAVPLRFGEVEFPGVRYVMPEFVLPSGTYELINSQPTTWVHNVGTRGRGFCTAFGISVGGIEHERLSEITAKYFPQVAKSSVDSLNGIRLKFPTAWTVRRSGPLMSTLTEDRWEQLLISDAKSEKDWRFSISTHLGLGEALQWYYQLFDGQLREGEDLFLADRRVTNYAFATAEVPSGQLMLLNLSTDESAGVLAILLWSDDGELNVDWQDLQQVLTDAIYDTAGNAVTVDKGVAEETKPLAPSSTSTPTESLVTLSFQDGQIYLHPDGMFELPIPDGWTLQSGTRNYVADLGFDSLLSPDGRLVFIIRRSAFYAEQPDVAARRWVFSKWQEALNPVMHLHQNKFAHVSSFNLGYEIPNGQSVGYRLAIYGPLEWTIINVIAKGKWPTAEIPTVATDLLDRLKLTRTEPRTSPHLVPPINQLGNVLLNPMPLEKLTNDFQLQVYQAGVILRHTPTNRQMYVAAVRGMDVRVLESLERFFQQDPDVRRQFGSPQSEPTYLFDGQLLLQVFEGGVGIVDPLNGKIWTHRHSRRAERRP